MTRVFALLTLLLVTAIDGNGQTPSQPMPPEVRLEAMWATYCARYITAAGAVVDPMRQGHVTSEAQSYALVRAVWMRARGHTTALRT